MRTLTDTLKAAQQSVSRDPRTKITFSKTGEDDIVIEEDRIVNIPSQEEQSDKQNAEIVFDNSDGYFTDLDLKGWQAVLEWGLVTKAGAEYSAPAPLKVISQHLSSAPGVLQCRLSLAGIPNLLAEDKASKDYFHHWSDTKTVKAMITEIADGQPVETELTEEQAEADSFIDLKGGIGGAGQRLTITERTITKLAFKLKKTGSPSGVNVTFRIRDVETEEILASKTFPIASITESFTWCEVTFDTPVEVDQEVWLYVEHTAGTDTNYISVRYNSYAIKPEEWFIQVNEGMPYITDWSDRDCTYYYKYIGAGIDCFDHCQAYEVVYDSEDDLIDSYQPKDSLKIYEGDSRLSIINRLLYHTGCEKRVRADGKIHVFVPTTTGETYDSEYSLDSGHIFFSKAVRKALVIPSRIVVHSLTGDKGQYSGEATDAESYALLPISDFRKTKLISNAQATSIAQAMMSRQQMDAQRGAAIVPMNLGAEVFDYVPVTDSRQKDTWVGNIGYIKRSYKPGVEFNMVFSFGRLPLKSVAGTRPSLLKESKPKPEPTLDEAVLQWGMIKPTLEIIEDNFEYIWKTLDDIIDIVNQIVSALGWFEGETPTNLQILLALMNYYTKAQVDNVSVSEPSKGWGPIYQNGNRPRLVQVAWESTGTGDQGLQEARIGAESPPTTLVNKAMSDEAEYPNFASMSFLVPPNYYYSVVSMLDTPIKRAWVEYDLHG